MGFSSLEEYLAFLPSDHFPSARSFISFSLDPKSPHVIKTSVLYFCLLLVGFEFNWNRLSDQLKTIIFVLYDLCLQQ